ncbi:MAG: acyl carrier protein [Alphaproteobacteria bacterium]|nr:acyl carrier protein [Alphaproteobacteria bacterium]MBV8549610.1 acyl carrier protein [Alphaproteobacteria bacterium]
MDISAFIEKFIEAIDFAEPVEITPDTVIAELDNWDSLAQLGVIVMIDIEFSKTLTADDIVTCRTVQGLYNWAQG